MNLNLSVKNKIFTLFVLVIVIAVSVVGWFGFKSAKESYISSALSINEGEARALSNKTKEILGTIPDDVLYNANFYALEKLLVWEDLKDKQKIRRWRNVYVSALKDYILHKKLYYQVRILDVNGNEKILLKYDEKTNKIVETSDSMLQNKAHRKYFQEAIKLKRGEFYISAMNLNIENGMIEKPYVPVVRYSTPLINENGEVKGVIVLNFSASYILDEIDIAQKRDDRKYYLINEDGYYLFSEDKTKRWGFQLGSDYNFKKDYSGIMEKFKDKDEITFIENDKIFSMHKVYPNKINNKYRYWYLIAEIDKDIALASLDTFVNIFFIILVLVLALGLLFINWYISKIMNPLTKVTSQLKALSRGQIQKESIEYKAEDEIGQIVHSTTILVDAIDTTIKQAHAVADGDFSKEIELLSKDDSLGLAIKEMTTRLKEITALATSLSDGNYDVTIIAKGSNDKLGLALLDMVKYLETITNITESISVGELDVHYKSKGEDDRLGIAILKMIKYLKAILKQAENITNENFTQSVEVKSQRDELGISITKMTTMLRDSSAKNKDEIFFSDGVGVFSDKLSGITDTMELSKVAITVASRYIGGSSGVLYTYDKEEETLNLVASFAYVSRDTLANSFKLGSGVVGQVGLEKEPILLKNIKDAEFEVQSGTTLSKAKEVYTFPLIHEGELFGVAEIMSFEDFSEIHIDYLLKISAIFATALHTTSQNSQIKGLLEKSQMAYEELQVQSEELQETNVQMEEQQQQLTMQSKELREQNDNLEVAKKEIDQRADDLEKASAYKSEFLANMSHELRTPLNSIILLSKLLTQNHNNTLDEKDVEKTDVIHKAGNDLLALINDILDLSKIESGNMELVYEDTHSEDIVKDMRGLFNAVADERGVEFIIDDSYNAVFSTDKTKLEQVLKNLLSNSFKFTKSGSVTLSFLEKDNMLEIFVKDTGIGIPADKVGHIFEAFKQVDGSISREYGGTGLGLSITKTILDLMDAEIVLDSVEKEGSTFTIYVPLIKGAKKIMKKEVKEKPVQKATVIDKVSKTESLSIMEKESESAFEDDTFSGKNILLVDDDSRNIFTLTSTLENYDAEVYTAFNGKEAIEVLEDDNNKIDLILMDIMMPVMDGINAIKKIKADDKYKDIPIIVITAKTMAEDKEQCIAVGANDYLSKPIDHDALITTMKAWIK